VVTTQKIQDFVEKNSGVTPDVGGDDVILIHNENYFELIKLLKEDTFNFLSDLTCVDSNLYDVFSEQYEFDTKRFAIVVNLLSHTPYKRIRVISFVDENEPIESLTSLYGGVNFAEREVFDLFGVSFNNHPNLTRILMPDEWDGHPLRKDFPTSFIPVTFKATKPNFEGGGN
jgi:NADH-quinone oxidoreductase subunit C